MYKNLERAMREHCINRTALAAILGVDIKTITNRMAGIYDWTLSEVTKITELFPEYTQNWLFERTEKAAAV